MFFGIIFLVIGLAILLNAVGVLTGNVWGIFWGVVFIAIGLKMMRRKGICPMCHMGAFGQRMHGKFHQNEKCCGDECYGKGEECCGKCDEGNCDEKCCEGHEHK